MPTATDLVTDLPADFEVFGQAVDTDFVDLLGGTTGQILSKTSATDLDFTWIANDQGDITGVTAGNGITVTSPTGPVPTVAIDTAVTVDKTTAQTLTNKTLTSPALTTPTISTATTNGDILYGTGSGALQRLGIGSASQVLSVSGGIPSWATPAAAASGLTLISTTTFTAASSASLPVGTFSSTYDNYKVIATVTPSTAAGIRYRARIGGVDNTNTADYKYQQIGADNTTISGARQTALGFWNLGSYGTIKTFQTLEISGLFETAYPQITSSFIYDPAANAEAYIFYAGLAVTTSYDSLTFFPSTGTMTGTIKVYGYQK